MVAQVLRAVYHIVVAPLLLGSALANRHKRTLIWASVLLRVCLPNMTAMVGLFLTGWVRNMGLRHSSA